MGVEPSGVTLLILQASLFMQVYKLHYKYVIVYTQVYIGGLNISKGVQIFQKILYWVVQK